MFAYKGCVTPLTSPPPWILFTTYKVVFGREYWILFMPPTSKKLRKHIGLGLSMVRGGCVTLCIRSRMIRNGILKLILFGISMKNKRTRIFSSPEPKAHWWAYRIGRPLSSISVYIYVCSVYVNIFKHLLLWNYWVDWSQISHGASLGRENESLFKRSWSHDQDGHHAYIW